MSLTKDSDAIVIGSGPNGLAAAIALAQAGWSVTVLEACDTPGGGARTKSLTLDGFEHDVCSAIHPMAIGSPFFQSLNLHEHGLMWIHPALPAAHPFDDGTAAVLMRDVDATAELLGSDAGAYRKLMHPLVRNWPLMVNDLLAPAGLPRHSFTMLRFACKAVASAEHLSNRWFEGSHARGLFAGMAGHSILPLSKIPSAAIALVLAAAGHVAGWPLVRGGSQRLTDALVSKLRSLGGQVQVGHRVDSLRDLPPSRVVLFDLTPRQIVQIAGDDLPDHFRKRLLRYRYGPGVFKMDWALDGPIPWAAHRCAQAGTVHLGGTFEEIAASEQAPWDGTHAEKPFVLLAQPTIFDPSRAPSGKHIAWGYCHVPSGSTQDMTQRIESQIERFAPGFRDRILARHTMNTTQMQTYNANYIGGDITGGVNDLWQLFTRPTARISPYTTPNPRLFICSASTPPGGGVHGMCGYHAARAVLKRMR